MKTRVALLAAFVVVAAPAGAQGSVTVGQSPPSGIPDTCMAGSSTSDLLAIAIAGGNSYDVPSSGVLTSWRTSAASGSFINALRVFTGSNTTFTPVAESAAQAIVPGGPEEFPTRIPVTGGERVGLKYTGTGYGCYFNTGLMADQFGSTTSGPIGTPENFSGPGCCARPNVSAVLEPDCDRDGFGDETQDQDVLACGTPNTTITKGPKDKSKKKQATFEFTSNIPGATFECSLDSGPFTPCTAPHTLKVKKGKHSFAVQAVTSLGNADGSPATDDWKVKKKKKRR